MGAVDIFLTLLGPIIWKDPGSSLEEGSLLKGVGEPSAGV